MTVVADIVYLNPRSIEPNRDNVRRQVGDIVGLAESIREHGILQPLGVVRQDGGYRVVYGDRRREAAIVVGLDRVPCLVLGELNEEGRLIRNILENLQRLDLNDLEKARAFEKMRDTLLSAGYDRTGALDAMTRRLGLSASQIKRYLGLLDLTPIVHDFIAAGDLTVTQAQHLRQLSPQERQEAVARMAVQEHLSAAELSKLASALARNPNIEPMDAFVALRRGEEISDLTQPQRDAGPMHLPPPPPPKSEDEDLFEEAEPEDEDALKAVASGTTTRDGNRVRKFHSLDSFVDEADRMARCAQDGDLIKLVSADADGDLKLRLLAKQMAFLARAVGEMAGLNSGYTAEVSGCR